MSRIGEDSRLVKNPSLLLRFITKFSNIFIAFIKIILYNKLLSTKRKNMENITSQLLAQSTTEIINTLVARSWLLALAALAIVLVSQRESVMSFAHAKQKTFKLAKPILEPFKYTGLGLLLVYGAYTVTSLVTTLIFPRLESATEVSEGVLATLKFHASYSGLMFTFMIVLAGLFMIPSVGNKWMIGVSKVLLTIAFIYMVLMSVIAIA